jgi:uncharacterized protein YegP (UPF0339 family)
MLNFQIYRGRDGDWYWRAKHKNGNVVADAGEGYSTASNARRAVRRFIGTIWDGKYVIEAA